MEELDEVGDVIVLVPDKTDHKPFPIVGVFADKVYEGEQTVASIPANDILGLESWLIITEEELTGQTPLLIFHCNILLPIDKPVTKEFDKVGVITELVPDNTVHKPKPMVGVFADKV
jgi:hypothetical protein